MGNKIIDIKGEEHQTECIACSIRRGEITLPVERIIETENFVVEQDIEYPIEGFWVVVSKRHIHAIDELSEKEVAELTELLIRTRKILRKFWRISRMSLIQEERSECSHFHIWFFPWHPWMLEKWKGKLNEIKEIMNYSKKNFSDSENLENIRSTIERFRKEIENLK